MVKEKISVIIPVYNVAEYLIECMESVINQTYKNIEIILVDDGSTDYSRNICDEYEKKDRRIRVIHKKNGGLSDARNAGINIASGTYITFIDSDDKITVDMIEYLWTMLISQNVDMSVCQCDYIDERSNLIKNRGLFNDSLILGTEKCMEAFLENPGFNTVAWGKLYKRTFFENVRYPVGKYHEDIFTTYRLVDMCSSVAIGKERKYLYRKRVTSISRHEFSIKHLDAVEGAECRANYIEKKYKALSNLARRSIITATNHCTLKMIQEGCKDKKYVAFLQERYRKYSNSYLYCSTSAVNKVLTLAAYLNLNFTISTGIFLTNYKKIRDWLNSKVE